MAPDALADAIVAFIARQERTQHPDGEFDSKRRWQPSPSERRACCHLIRTPSARYPYTLMKHCRTVTHIAELYEVDASALRTATRRERPAQRLGGDYYKAVVQLEDGRLVSVYDRTTEYRIGVTLVERVRKNHGGGYYVRRTLEGALAAGRELLRGSYLPPVVLRVRAEGQYTVYKCDLSRCHENYGCGGDHDKIAFSRVTPLEVIRQEDPQ